MTVIPGTSTAANFIALTSEYPPLFYSAGKPGPKMGSVNAGNQALYVGGGGVNRGFNNALTKAGQDTSAYQTRQNALLHKTAADTTGTETYADTDPISFSSVMNSPVAHDKLTGLTFVDIFGAGRLPHNNPANIAMVYTTPPDGRTYPMRDGFLTDVEATATKLIRSVATHNASADSHGVSTLPAVRMCLYSSGIFNAHFDDDGTRIPYPDAHDHYIGKDGLPKPKVALDEIAMRIYHGLVAGLTEAPSGIDEIQFPYSTDKHDPLFNAVRVTLNA